MITVGTPLKGCKGTFDCTISNRPLSANFPNPFPTPGPTNTPYWRYQDSTGLIGTLLRVPPKVAPYSTLHWLIRNSHMPLIGQEPFDIDGVGGFAFPAPDGWAQVGRLPRVPKTLVVCSNQIAFDIQAAIAAIAPALNAVGVDVMLSTLSPARFSSALPVDGCSFHPAVSGGIGGFNPGVGIGTFSPAADMQGGDVMYAGVGFFLSGYDSGFFDSSSGGDQPTYLWAVNSGSTPPPFTDPVVTLSTDTVGGVTTYYVAYTNIAATEAAALVQVAAQCRKFQFDIYGDVQRPTIGNSTCLTPGAAGSIFRFGVPGFENIYDSLDPTAFGALLLSNAISFFS